MTSYVLPNAFPPVAHVDFAFDCARVQLSPIDPISKIEDRRSHSARDRMPRPSPQKWFFWCASNVAACSIMIRAVWWSCGLADQIPWTSMRQPARRDDRLVQ